MFGTALSSSWPKLALSGWFSDLCLVDASRSPLGDFLEVIVKECITYRGYRISRGYQMSPRTSKERAVWVKIISATGDLPSIAHPASGTTADEALEVAKRLIDEVLDAQM